MDVSGRDIYMYKRRGNLIKSHKRSSRGSEVRAEEREAGLGSESEAGLGSENSLRVTIGIGTSV